MTTYVSLSFTGADGAGWPLPMVVARSTTGSASDILTNRGRLYSGTLTGYAGKRYMRYDTGPVANTEFTGVVNFPVIGANDQMFDLVGRCDIDNGGGNGYTLSIWANGKIQFTKAVAYTYSNPVADVPFTIVAATDYKFRYRVVGTSIQFRIWAASGAEPGTWQMNFTDAGLATGYAIVGLTGGGGGFATVYVDDLLITDGAAAVPAQGSASGAVTRGGTASGTRMPSASATGTTAWAGTGVGMRPITGVNTGVTAGVVAWSGTAAGARPSVGTTTGALSFIGAALGVSVPAGSEDRITIGAAFHSLDGTNVARDVNQIIRYTNTGVQTVTPTNQYGIEVTVLLSTMTVTSVNNRLASGSTAGTAIPVGSIVLSGHGQGVGTGGQWLLDYATVGAVVSLTLSGIDRQGSAAGTVLWAGPVAQQTSGQVVSVYHHSWSGPYLRNYPADVQGIVNEVRLSIAQSAAAGTGLLTYAPYNGQSVADHAADVRAFIARGCNVLMAVGGSSDGGITIQSNAQADQAFNSMQGFVTTYGINGFDIDLEPSGSAWAEGPLVYLCQRLKTTYGSGFIIGITPGLYGEHTARWMALAQALGNNYDYMAPMLYDFPEAGDSRLTTEALNKCAVMRAGGVPESKMELGFMMRPDAAYVNSTPTTALAINAWNACKAQYPLLKGFFNWEDYILHSIRSWDLMRTLGAQISTGGVVPMRSGSATGTITRSGSATGSRVSVGPVAGTVAWAGTTVGVGGGGTPDAYSDTYSDIYEGFVVNTSAGTVAWDGASVGSRSSQGTAAGTIVWSGLSVGSKLQTGASNGTVGWAGVSTSASVLQGAATGTVGFAATATGSRPAGSAVAALLTWAGTAVGSRPAGAAATGTVGWAGTGGGAQSAVGAATGAVNWTTTGSGSSAPDVGTATGAVGFTGTASGTMPSASQASGTFTWSATGVGSKFLAGSAAGSVDWSVSGSGARTANGSATGAVAIAGGATGVAPIVGTSQGTVVGTVGWTGSGSGSGAVYLGSAAGTATWTGAAAGSIAPSATTTGTVSWSAIGSGTTSPTGLSSGTVGWTGTGIGSSPNGGSVVGTVGWVGSGVGVSPVVGINSGSGVGSLTWTAAGAGAAIQQGVVTGTVQWTAIGGGARDPISTGAGAVDWEGATIGSTVRQATAVGDVTWSGTGQGVRAAGSPADGSVTWILNGSGGRNSDGDGRGDILWQTTGTGLAPGERLGDAAGEITWTASGIGESRQGALHVHYTHLAIGDPQRVILTSGRYCVLEDE